MQPYKNAQQCSCMLYFYDLNGLNVINAGQNTLL